MRLRSLMVAAAVLWLGGCDLLVPPPTEPLVEPTVPAPPPAPEPSAASRALTAYYAQVQSELLSQGLMRRDGGSQEIPFGARDLAQDFVRIALYDEYTINGDHLIARAQPATLRRWETPIRMSVEFGASVPPEKRRKDFAEIQSYVARLSRLSGLPISLGDGHPNFRVLVLNEDERLGFDRRLQQLEPDLTAAARRSIIEIPRSIFCFVRTFTAPGAPSVIYRAISVIRAEQPDFMRLACINEELAQGLGLTNDSPNARPSIFNDDGEFALLTPHDEMLLRMLYDPRLKPGMRAAQALPIVRQIADEYFGGNG